MSLKVLGFDIHGIFQTCVEIHAQDILDDLRTAKKVKGRFWVSVKLRHKDWFSPADRADDPGSNYTYKDA